MGVMAWLVKMVMGDAQKDRRECAEERRACLISLAEHSIRDADAFIGLKETLIEIKRALIEQSEARVGLRELLGENRRAMEQVGEIIRNRDA